MTAHLKGELIRKICKNRWDYSALRKRAGQFSLGDNQLREILAGGRSARIIATGDEEADHHGGTCRWGARRVETDACPLSGECAAVWGRAAYPGGCNQTVQKLPIRQPRADEGRSADAARPLLPGASQRSCDGRQ